MDQLARAKNHLEVLLEQQAVFDDTSSNEYPKGVRSFRSNQSFCELDNKFSLAAEGTYPHTVHTPCGSSRREAGELVYRSFLHFWKNIEVESQRELVQDLTQFASPDNIEEIAQVAYKALDQTDLAENLGLTCPLQKISFVDVKQVVTNKYKQLYIAFEKSLN